MMIWKLQMFYVSLEMSQPMRQLPKRVLPFHQSPGCFCLRYFTADALPGQKCFKKGFKEKPYHHLNQV